MPEEVDIVSVFIKSLDDSGKLIYLCSTLCFLESLFPCSNECETHLFFIFIFINLHSNSGPSVFIKQCLSKIAELAEDS